MGEVTFVRCPKCQAAYWDDIPNTTKVEETRWKCSRCGYLMVIGKCSKCETKNWAMTKGIDPKGGHRPMYRLQCGTCQRIIGLLIQS